MIVYTIVYKTTDIGNVHVQTSATQTRQIDSILHHYIEVTTVMILKSIFGLFCGTADPQRIINIPLASCHQTTLPPGNSRVRRGLTTCKGKGKFN